MSHVIKKSGRLVISTGLVGNNSAYMQCIVPFTKSEIDNKRYNTKPWHVQYIKKSNLKESGATGYAG